MIVLATSITCEIMLFMMATQLLTDASTCNELFSMSTYSSSDTLPNCLAQPPHLVQTPTGMVSLDGSSVTFTHRLAMQAAAGD